VEHTPVLVVVKKRRQDKTRREDKKRDTDAGGLRNSPEPPLGNEQHEKPVL
jgi:hypothetical protein